MEWEGLVLLFLAVLIFGVPLVALVLALQAATRARQALQQVQELHQRVARLAPSWVLEKAGEAAPAPAEAPTLAEAPAPPPGVSPAPVAPPLTPSGPPPGPPEMPQPHRSLEERIGLTWLTRLGAAVLILGAMYFFKYAVDNNWIGPWGRVALGAGLGVGVLVFAERLRNRLLGGYLHGLLGVGVSLLYVSCYAAYGFYRLLPLAVAFGALTVVVALGGLLASRYRSQLTLVIALLAAFANPVLLSTGEDRPLGLAAYLLLVTSATFLVALLHRFLGLAVLSLTVGKLAVWDVWRLPRLSQVLVLVAVGVLLLGAGFLYARFGSRLMGFLRTGAGVLAFLAWQAAPGAAVDVGQFASMATVVAAAPGLVVVPVPLELYRASASPAGFEDLRIVAADG